MELLIEIFIELIQENREKNVIQMPIAMRTIARHKHSLTRSLARSQKANSKSVQQLNFVRVAICYGTYKTRLLCHGWQTGLNFFYSFSVKTQKLI